MYMHEILPIVSAMRLPVVMGLANRAVSGPLNIWNDHTDIMPQRDSGWIAIFAENGQEVVDMSIQSFKIAEHPDVMLPDSPEHGRFPADPHGGSLGDARPEGSQQVPPGLRPYATLHPDRPVSMGTASICRRSSPKT